ncbi:MAG: DUF6311 domain-containing protein [Rhodobacterales bacterium]|nr:DUF6311 domain-containing protein [Rhodobacterales bacterium]
MWQDTQPNQGNDLKSTVVALAVVSAFAAALFLAFGGATILDFTNTSWLKGGDPSQHLLGWLFYRQTDLTQLPIGLNPKFGELTSGSIVYSDSIPLFAVAFRFLNPILPETFQYFGLWILTCFLLQGLFGYWLLRLLSAARGVAAVGACLLLASPYMLWRLHGHEALMGHWILLATACLYLLPQMRWGAWALLLVIAVAVHGYLAAMAGAVWVTRMWLERRDMPGTVIRAGVTFAGVSGVAWLLGYFAIPSAGSGKDGFGLYRTTLASWIDSDGMWGQLLPDLPSDLGTYEGFAYLGLGALVVAILTCLGQAWRIWHTNLPKLLPRTAVSLMPLLWTCMAFTLFALSHRISILGHTLFDIDLPNNLPIVTTFRASGRFIWLPSYMLVALSIVWLARAAPARAAVPVLGVAALVQVADMTQAMQFFRERFAEPQPQQFTADFWDAVGARYDRIVAWPVDPHSPEVIEASFVAVRQGMSIDQAYLARSDGHAFSQTGYETQSQLTSSSWQDDTLYMIHDQATAEFLATQMAETSQEVFFAEVDGVWVVAPGWTGCRRDCGARPAAPEPLAPTLLPPDGILTLTDGGNFDPYKRWGWSSSEAQGRWTEGPLATFVVALGQPVVRPVSIEMIASPYLADGAHGRDVKIRANGRTLLETNLTDPEMHSIIFEAPPQTFSADGVLLLEIQISNSLSPFELGLSEDVRKLGLYVQSVSFRSAGS